MEIYRNSVNARVSIVAPSDVVPVGDEIDVKAYDNSGNLIYTFDTVLRSTSAFAVELPWSLTRQDRNFFVLWDFNYLEDGVEVNVKEKSLVKIISPILPLAEVKSISGFTDDSDVIDLERKVRKVINHYTGQNFGLYKTTYKVYNSDASSLLSLPSPLLQVETVESGGKVAYDADVFIEDHGWSLSIKRSSFYNVKSDTVQSSTGAIVAPYSAQAAFHRAFVNITGTWGFYNVPDAVEQAARILVADYSCDESLWRERYITSIRAADWRFDFDPSSTEGTGNVIADQLLSEYRKKSLAVI